MCLLSKLRRQTFLRRRAGVDPLRYPAVLLLGGLIGTLTSFPELSYFGLQLCYRSVQATAPCRTRLVAVPHGPVQKRARRFPRVPVSDQFDAQNRKTVQDKSETSYAVVRVRESWGERCEGRQEISWTGHAPRSYRSCHSFIKIRFTSDDSTEFSALWPSVVVASVGYLFRCSYFRASATTSARDGSSDKLLAARCSRLPLFLSPASPIPRLFRLVPSPSVVYFLSQLLRQCRPPFKTLRRGTPPAMRTTRPLPTPSS